MAYKILQRQIEHIDGNRDNIIVPSVRMKQIRQIREAEGTDAIIVFL